jgi:DICT domain-containing protein
VPHTRSAGALVPASAATSPSASAALASTNSRRASASATIERKLAGVTDAASGATTAPARNAPRKIVAYRAELRPQIAIACPARTPSRCRLAATRFISASSAP